MPDIVTIEYHQTAESHDKKHRGMLFSHLAFLLWTDG